MTRLVEAWTSNFNNSPAVITDFGGNVGDMATELAEAFPDAELYSYEPVPANYAVLTKRTAKYPNVRCINKGVADKEGTALIGISHDREASNVGLFSILHPDGQNSQEIELVDIKTLIERPELVKMDVEGLEYLLFKSGPKYFSNTKLIFYEHLPVGHANYHEDLEKIPELLKSWGFEAYDEIKNHNITYVRLS